MLNNLKNILISIFAAIIVVAVGASAYTAFASPDADQIAAPAALSNAKRRRLYPLAPRTSGVIVRSPYTNRNPRTTTQP